METQTNNQHKRPKRSKAPVVFTAYEPQEHLGGPAGARAARPRLSGAPAATAPTSESVFVFAGNTTIKHLAAESKTSDLRKAHRYQQVVPAAPARRAPSRKGASVTVSLEPPLPGRLLRRPSEPSRRGRRRPNGRPGPNGRRCRRPARPFPRPPRQESRAHDVTGSGRPAMGAILKPRNLPRRQLRAAAAATRSRPARPPAGPRPSGTGRYGR